MYYSRKRVMCNGSCLVKNLCTLKTQKQKTSKQLKQLKKQH